LPDILDQTDIEALLQAVETGGVEEPTVQSQIFSRFRRDLENVEIKTYDFKRPERISKDQMRALQTLHETFARNFGAALSGFLRTIVEVNVSAVEQLTYSEFIDALPNPTSFNLIKPSSLEGRFCLELSPLIIYPIIDRLLGGASQDLFVPHRPMTVIETRLVQRILSRAMSALSEAWSGITSVSFELGEMESNPQLVQIVPPNEVVVVVRFELKMGKRAGTMSVCIPFTVIEPVVHKLDSQNWFTTSSGKTSETLAAVIGERLSDAGVDVSGLLAETTITLRDLRNLEVGDVITTSKPSLDPVLMCIEGVPKFLARIGQFKGRRAMQVIREVKATDRL
jgi:flagellar motor switch protein FliM